MKPGTIVCLLAVLSCGVAAPCDAQDRAWIVEGAFGRAWFVDESPDPFVTAGAGARWQMSPRVSLGPEMTWFSASHTARDLIVTLTGNVVIDAFAQHGPGARRVTPFVVAGAGLMAGRDQVRGGPYWWREGGFTAGGGVRGMLTSRLSLAADYRIGSELHQRVSAVIGAHF